MERDLLFLRINLKRATVFLLVSLMDVVKNSLLLYYVGIIPRPMSLCTIQLRNSICSLTAAEKDCDVGSHTEMS